MGGLFRALPQTGVVFLVGTLALAGVWPLAGFFSKEAVLAGVWEAGMTVPFLMLALTAFLTAFYMFRVVFIAFFGRPHAPHGAHGHLHDAPLLMAGPLWVLAGLTVAGAAVSACLAAMEPATRSTRSETSESRRTTAPFMNASAINSKGG